VWSYNSAPPTCLHGVDRENITITFTPYKDCSLIFYISCVVALGAGWGGVTVSREGTIFIHHVTLSD